MTDVFVLVNDAQRPLLEQFFRPTLARCEPAARLNVIEAPVADGTFKGSGYLDVIIAKVRLILGALSGEDREPLIWSDIDVTFHGTSGFIDAALAELGAAPLAFQQESPWLNDVNTGFMVARRCAEARQPFEKILAALLRQQSERYDQDYMNELIENGLSVKRLSTRFLTNSYRRLAGWNTLPADTLVFHANWSFTVAKKKSLLRQYQLTTPHPVMN